MRNRCVLGAALAAMAASDASGQTVRASRADSPRIDTLRVDTLEAVPPSVRAVRARVDALRHGRIVQPIVVLVPAPSAAASRAQAGRTGEDVILPVPVPILPPGQRPETGRPPPSVPRTPPVAADTSRRTPSDPVVIVTPEARREIERQIVELGLFRTTAVHFEFDRARLLAGSDAILDVVGDVLQRYPELRVEIGGHTDAVGSDAYNQALSQRRAATVEAYLRASWQIAPERLQAVGYGEGEPFTTNANETGRALNRRVEFRVVPR